MDRSAMTVGLWAAPTACPRRRFLVGSDQHEAFALRFGDGVPELSRGVNPKLDSFIGVGERFLRETALQTLWPPLTAESRLPWSQRVYNLFGP